MEKTKYPYFVNPMLKELAETTDSDRAGHLRRLIAANVSDSDALSDLLGLTECRLSDFYMDAAPETPGTEDTIKIFLERFGSKDDKEEKEVAELEIPIAPPAIDYASMILEQSENENDTFDMQSPGDSTSNAIDSFLKAVPPKVPAPRRRELPAEPEQATLTESFAKILIKNHNYSKALDIIKELNLKNPEKSIYFADQIRFLEKLIKYSRS